MAHKMTRNKREDQLHNHKLTDPFRGAGVGFVLGVGTGVVAFSFAVDELLLSFTSKIFIKSLIDESSKLK